MNSQTDSLRSSSHGVRVFSLAKDSLLYGASSAVNRLLGLFIMPVLTRIFSEAEYGAMDALLVVTSSLVLFATMGQDSAVARYFYEVESPDERKKVISEAFLIEIFFCAVVTIPGLIFAYSLAEQIMSVPGYSQHLILCMICVPLTLIVNFTQNLFKWSFARKQFIFMSLGWSIFFVIITLLLVVVFQGGVLAVFYSHVITNLCFMVIGLILCRRHLTWVFPLSYIRPLLRFGFPYMIIALATAFVPVFDRLAISHFLGLDLLGTYAVGSKIALLIMLPVMAFQTAWGPFSFAIYKESNAEETYNHVLRYYTIFICASALALVIVAKPVTILLASAKYASGSVVVLPLVLTVVVESAAWIAGLGIDLSKKTYLSATSYFTGLITTGIALLLLTKPFGLLGVAVAVLVGRIVQAGSYMAFGRYSYHFHFMLRMPLTIIVLTGLLGIIIEAAPFSTLGYHIAFRTLIFVLFCYVVWQTALLPKEKQLILTNVTFRSRGSLVGDLIRKYGL